jgi:acetyltransferase-like isoleucine patch superfamily enzyme
MPPWLRDICAGAVQEVWGWVCDVGAVGPQDARGRRFGSMGAGSCISFPPGSVFGERWIRIGANTLIGPHVSLSAGMAPGQRMETDPVVRIGDRCSIGRGSCIVGHRSIEIGDDVTTAPYVYVTDQNHSYGDVTTPIGRQWPVEAPVRIGSGCWLGTGVVVLPGADIGDNVVVAAGAVVRGEIPSRTVVAGAPARVVRSYDGVGGWDPPLPESATTPPPDWPA